MFRARRLGCYHRAGPDVESRYNRDRDLLRSTPTCFLVLDRLRSVLPLDRFSSWSSLAPLRSERRAERAEGLRVRTDQYDFLEIFSRFQQEEVKGFYRLESVAFFAEKNPVFQKTTWYRTGLETVAFDAVKLTKQTRHF